MEKAPYIKYKNIYVIPTFHSRIEFAKLVRVAFFKVFPDVVAVELPSNVSGEVIEGVERLPYLSLIAYADTLNPKKMNFIPIDPGDSIIEGIRTGLDHNVRVEFVDLSVSDYVPPAFKLPDDYSINEIGLNVFYDKISTSFEKEYQNKKKELRDRVSLNEFLKNQEESAKEYDYVEKDVLREKYMASHLLRMMPLHHRILFIVGMAHWENIKYYLEYPEKVSDVELSLSPFKFVQVFNIESADARFLLKEIPYHTHKWIKFREKYSKELVDRIETPEELFKLLNSYKKIEHITEILLRSKRSYEKEFKEFVDLHKLKTLFQYVRNLTITEQRLLPELYHLLVAAKNSVDDDYAWTVLEVASRYPYNDKSKKYKTMKLSGQGGYDPNGRYVRLRRYHPYEYGKDRDFPLKKKKKEGYPGEWRDKWEEEKHNLVSYPPEDVLVEDYFSYMRKRAMKSLKNQRVRIEEFKSSLLDGIDIKETLRNWAIKKKVFVRNEQQIQGKIDTIVVIFDKDDGEREKYPFKLTWYAEHEKESTLALYTTYPGEFLVGPGITHVEIGGFLSIYPPKWIREVFVDYFETEYQDVQNKAERLLKAAILNSRERYIVYFAKEPPRKYFYNLAGLKNREIAFMSLDTYSQKSLKTIKRVHMLAGRDKRKIAHDYIFLKR